MVASDTIQSLERDTALLDIVPAGLSWDGPPAAADQETLALWKWRRAVVAALLEGRFEAFPQLLARAWTLQVGKSSLGRAGAGLLIGDHCLWSLHADTWHQASKIRDKWN